MNKSVKIFTILSLAFFLFTFSSVQAGIVVQPTTLDFDSVHIGFNSTLPIMVFNIGGTAALNVSNITTNNTAFTVDTTAFTLAVGDSQQVNVTFSPITPGTYYNFLYVFSDDPQSPVVPVILQGEGIEEPVVGVAPDTFDVSLAVGEILIDTLTIFNTGITPLNYTIAVEGQLESPLQSRLQANIISDQVLHNKKLNAIIRKRSGDVSSVNTYAEDQFTPNKEFRLPDYIDGEEIFGSTSSSFSGGSRDRGNVFQVTTSTRLLEHKLYLDIASSTEIYFFVYEGTNVTGTFNKINEVHITNSGTGQGFYSSGSISVPLETGYYYYIGASWLGSATYYRGNETTPIPCSFGFLETGIPGSIAGGFPPAATANSTYNGYSPYYCAIVTGAGADWITADPDTGMVLPDDSMEVQVTFNPAGLLGGDYYADLVISSNDSVNPEVRVGAHMFVIGEAAISAEPDSLNFATPLVIGVQDSLNLMIFNNGNGVLDVSDITSTNPVFSVSSSTFSVPPFDSLEIQVFFTPTVAGAETGTLSIMSNDPNTPTLDVYVQGEGIEAPVVGVIPTSFDVSVPSDTFLTEIMTISNNGNGPLFFNIVIEGAEKTNVPLKIKNMKLIPHNKGLASGKAVVTNQRNTYYSSNVSDKIEVSPILKPYSGILPLEAPWDLQFSFDLEIASGALGNAGAEFDGTYYYTTRWAANLIHKYDLTGNLVQEFSVTGVTGLRDLAYDGTYMYGGAASTTIYQMDFVTNTLIGTITSPVSVRFIAYDEANDAFWVGNWSDPPTLVDRSGATLATLTTGLAGQYGAAYDGWSEGGPYLWVFDQGAGAGTPQLIHQFDLNTLTATGFTHDVTVDIPGTAGIAGGLWTGEGVVGGKASIGGCLQGTPDMFFVYELADALPLWLSVDTLGGTIPPLSSLDVTCTFDPTGLLGGDYYANIYVNSNDPVTPQVDIGVHMFVDAEPNISTNPDSLYFANDLFLGASETKTLQVKNDAPGVLEVTDITIIPSNSIFTVDTTIFSVPAFDSFAVSVTFAPLDTGTFSAVLQIANNDPDTPVLDVYVEGTAIPAPVAVVTAPPMPILVNVGDSADIFVNIGNAGGNDLLWSATALYGPSPPPMERQHYTPVSPSQTVEAAPDNGNAFHGFSIEAPWDLQFSFDLEIASGALGNAGAEFDGTYYYTTRWAANLIHKYDMAGNLVQEFSVAGVSGLRDLAFDGTYMYGGAAANTIYMMDFDTQTLVGTISSPVGVRNIAYDEANDAFWVANWGDPPTLVDRNGATLATLTTGLAGQYGTAYDGWSEGGPYLWVFDQGAGAGTPQLIHQFDLNTMTATGFTHDVTVDIPGTAGIAGGLWTGEGVVGGKASIGGCLQGTPDMFFVYELTDAGPTWMQIITTSGVVGPGDNFDIPVRIYGDTTSVDTAYIVISTNDPGAPVINVLVARDVPTGIQDQLTMPTTFAVSQNFPNPFNPSTTIKYQLPQSRDVTLQIFNVLGQKVRTLVNSKVEAGYHQAIWDGRNDIGNQVASGIYIYRFEAGDFQRTMKLMLLK